MNEKRKIVLVGCGFVGMSMAYSFLNTGGIDELVLIDVDQEKACLLYTSTITRMVAESKPEEKELRISLIMDFSMKH